MHLSGATPLRLWRATHGYGTTAQCAPVDRGGGGQPAGQERATAGGRTSVTVALASPGVLRRHGGRRSTGRPPIALAVVMAAIGAFVALLFIAGFHSVLVSGQHDVDALQVRLTAGRGETQMLRMKVAQLESPQRIQDLALGRLGLKTPRKVAYLTSVVLGDPTNPVPAPGDDPFGPTTP